jgi:hypothetical protein
MGRSILNRSAFLFQRFRIKFVIHEEEVKMDTIPVTRQEPLAKPLPVLTRAQYEELILRRLQALPIDRLAQLASFAHFLEYEFKQQETFAGNATEMLSAFADREVLIYTPVAADGAARALAESLGRDEYGNKK